MTENCPYIWEEKLKIVLEGTLSIFSWWEWQNLGQENPEIPTRPHLGVFAGSMIVSQILWNQQSFLLLEGTAHKQCIRDIWESRKKKSHRFKGFWKGMPDKEAQGSDCWNYNREPRDQKRLENTCRKGYIGEITVLWYTPYSGKSGEIVR